MTKGSRAAVPHTRLSLATPKIVQESQIANTANGVSGILVNPVVASKLATGTSSSIHRVVARLATKTSWSRQNNVAGAAACSIAAGPIGEPGVTAQPHVAMGGEAGRGSWAWCKRLPLEPQGCGMQR